MTSPTIVQSSDVINPVNDLNLSFNNTGNGLPVEIVKGSVSIARNIGQNIKQKIKAFHLLVVHPADFGLLGIFFDGKYYINKCLPEGCSIASALIEKFATFLHRTVASISGLDTLNHYLDDFFFAAANSTQNCTKSMQTFSKLCSQLAESKTVGPYHKYYLLRFGNRHSPYVG